MNNSYKAFNELTQEELVLVYEQWKEFMDRRKAQHLRALKQRKVAAAAKRFAEEHGFNYEATEEV